MPAALLPLNAVAIEVIDAAYGRSVLGPSAREAGRSDEKGDNRYSEDVCANAEYENDGIKEIRTCMIICSHAKPRTHSNRLADCWFITVDPNVITNFYKNSITLTFYVPKAHADGNNVEVSRHHLHQRANMRKAITLCQE
ncbi:hypothetical protein [Enterobacter sp. 155105]|uniref:hypothetical protein n=1 Tax=Enterobacter sp. 155105 TaxID=2980499 RepID=UPI0021CB1D96|nr:hypothetical protein [Enterobacter sp. 155105]UXP24738.1 hypothetical protein N8O08_03770 [Enterobacter sp. 155105]